MVRTKHILHIVNQITNSIINDYIPTYAHFTSKGQPCQVGSETVTLAPIKPNAIKRQIQP